MIRCRLAPRTYMPPPAGRDAASTAAADGEGLALAGPEPAHDTPPFEDKVVTPAPDRWGPAAVTKPDVTTFTMDAKNSEHEDAEPRDRESNFA